MKIHKHLFHETNVPGVSKDVITQMNAELITRCTNAANYLKAENLPMELYPKVAKLIHKEILNKWDGR